MRLPATLSRNRSPLEFLAIRPKSDADDIRLMLNAFALMSGQREEPHQVFLKLLSIAVKPKGIPTSEDQFVHFLARAIGAPSEGRRFVLLRRARSCLVMLNRRYEINARRKRGRSGGRGRKRGKQGPTISEVILNTAKHKLLQFPELAAKKTRFVVDFVASKSPQYRDLDLKEKKQLRDRVRKILRTAGLIGPKRLSSPFSDRAET